MHGTRVKLCQIICVLTIKAQGLNSRTHLFRVADADCTNGVIEGLSVLTKELTQSIVYCRVLLRHHQNPHVRTPTKQLIKYFDDCRGLACSRWTLDQSNIALSQ